MRIFKKLCPVWFMLGLFVINQFLTMALYPASGTTFQMWKTFREEEQIDMIYLGSSFTQEGIDPVTVDEESGLCSFNMGSSAQPLFDSYYALREAIRTKKISKAVVSLGVYSMQKRDRDMYNASFSYSMKQGQNLLQRLQTDLEFVFDEHFFGKPISINYFFPWVYRHVKPVFIWENLAINVKYRLGMDVSEEETEGVTPEELMQIEPEERRGSKSFDKTTIRKGYYTTNRVLDYNTIGNTNTKTVYTSPFDPSNYDYLDKICKLCEENDVDLMFICIPRSPLDLLCFGEEYFEMTEEWENFVTQRGVDFYDFDLVKPEYLALEDSDYADYEHLNVWGAEKFSSFLGKFVKAREQGQDVSEYFYTPEEYLASIDSVVNVFFTTEECSEGVEIHADSYQGSQTEVEYQFLWKVPGESEYQLIQDYSESKVCVFRPTGAEDGKYMVRVNARKVGNTGKSDRHFAKKITYRK